MLGATQTTSTKVVTTVKDYYWLYSAKYFLFVFQGNNPEKQVVLLENSGKCEVLTTTKDTPYPKLTRPAPIDLNLTWLISQLRSQQGLEVNFTINRSDAKCFTPRQNPNITAAISYFTEALTFSSKLLSYFSARGVIQANHGLDLSQAKGTSVFVPVIPLFEDLTSTQSTFPAIEGSSTTTSTTTTTKERQSTNLVVLPTRPPSVILSADDLNKLLGEHQRSLIEHSANLKKMFPDDGKLLTSTEAKIMMASGNTVQICNNFYHSVEFIEDLLRKQLGNLQPIMNDLIMTQCRQLARK